jgi:type III secretion protein U
MSDKPFPPSLKKLRDARKKGEFPRSAQLIATAVFGAVLFATLLSMPATLARFKAFFEAVDTMFQEGVGDTAWLQFYEKSLSVFMWTVAPVLAACIVAAIASGWFQTRGLLTLNPMEPKIEKLNPVSNLKKIFSVKQLLDLLKKLVETVVLGALIAGVAWKAIAPMLLSVFQPSTTTAFIGAQLVFSMFCTAVVFWIVVSAVDYGIQYFTFMRDQRMSFEDLKREFKDMEGDPYVKGQRKAIQQEMAQSAPQRPLKGASALIANPTHVAIAINFNAATKGLPTIHAKAMDSEALDMKSQARALGIPIFEDVPLARGMYRELAIDSAITPAFYAPVARIMVWVEELGAAVPSEDSGRKAN